MLKDWGEALIHTDDIQRYWFIVEAEAEILKSNVQEFNKL